MEKKVELIEEVKDLFEDWRPTEEKKILIKKQVFQPKQKSVVKLADLNICTKSSPLI